MAQLGSNHTRMTKFDILDSIAFYDESVYCKVLLFSCTNTRKKLAVTSLQHSDGNSLLGGLLTLIDQQSLTALDREQYWLAFQLRCRPRARDKFESRITFE